MTISSENSVGRFASFSETHWGKLVEQIKVWGKALGFAEIGITDINLKEANAGLQNWLAEGLQGEMAYMATHADKRGQPEKLVPGTIRIISVRMNYLPFNPDTAENWQQREMQRLEQPEAAVISVYARGRDYHKVMRSRLQKLAEQIQNTIGTFGYRVFSDSAPVMEVTLAEKAGIGWRGKHTLLLNRHAGSFFFLGEIYTNLPLPVDAPVSAHCGTCHACIDVCPTRAIIAPYKLDARRCISYLTIELKGSIPVDLRKLIGNRIYGCDDCQLVCPWNKFAQKSALADFDVREGFDQAQLIELFNWSEEEFNQKLAGSAIRRIGYERWLRNIAVALGNAKFENTKSESALHLKMIAALQSRLSHDSALVREHVTWALAQ